LKRPQERESRKRQHAGAKPEEHQTGGILRELAETKRSLD